MAKSVCTWSNTRSWCCIWLLGSFRELQADNMAALPQHCGFSCLENVIHQFRTQQILMHFVFWRLSIKTSSDSMGPVGPAQPSHATNSLSRPWPLHWFMSLKMTLLSCPSNTTWPLVLTHQLWGQNLHLLPHKFQALWWWGNQCYPLVSGHNVRTINIPW